MNENQENVVEINSDAAKSKARSFFARHKTKMVATALTLGAGTMFVLGRRSKDVIDVDVELHRDGETDNSN
jgi:hypothetical protein